MTLEKSLIPDTKRLWFHKITIFVLNFSNNYISDTKIIAGHIINYCLV